MPHSSSRMTPNQLGLGLDVSATRMQQDLQALANRLNAPLPTDIARRWVETHMTAGYIPTLMTQPAGVGVPITPLPWMGSFNGINTPGYPATNALTDPVTKFYNPWRQKGIVNPAISPTTVFGDEIFSWEMSWAQTKPCLLDRWTIVLATDSVYDNDFQWGPGAPAGKTNGQPVDDLVLQVLVDSALNTQTRTTTTMPFLLRDFRVDYYEMTQSAVQGVTDTMIPPTTANGGKVPRGLCIEVFPRCPLPENARVRMILSIPRYSNATTSSWGQAPWQTFVASFHTTLLEPISGV